MLQSIWTRRASLIKVTDGDTVRMYIDDGRRHFSEEAIRLKDVFAPEIFSGDNRAAGLAAALAAREWFETHKFHQVADWATDKWPFIVTTEADKMTFNRYVGWIECGMGHVLNEYMMDSL